MKSILNQHIKEESGDVPVQKVSIGREKILEFRTSQQRKQFDNSPRYKLLMGLSTKRDRQWIMYHGKQTKVPTSID
jgi:hypothetical protein